MRRFQIFLLIIFFLGSAITFLPADSIDGRITAGEYPFEASFDLVTVYWRIEGETISMALAAATQGWVALGLEPEDVMAGADMIVGWVKDGKTTVLDCYSTGQFGPHPPDIELGGTDDLISAAGTQEGGHTVVEFSRSLISDDQYDKPFSLSRPVSIIWAVGDDDDFDAYHVQAGFGALELGSGTASAAPRKLLLIGHATFLSVSFLLMVAGMLLARYLKSKKWWLKAHRRLGLSGGTLALPGLGLGIYMVEVTSGVHLKAVHTYVGLLTVVLIILTPIIGRSILKGKAGIQARRRLHRWSGRATLIMMLTTIVLGLFRAGIL
ncbi:MAG: hypothetical protein GH155_00660 [Spirochaeta sp.]|nr:hypothetical protein [Spirochaeta sp.]